MAMGCSVSGCWNADISTEFRLRPDAYCMDLLGTRCLRCGLSEFSAHLLVLDLFGTGFLGVVYVNFSPSAGVGTGSYVKICITRVMIGLYRSCKRLHLSSARTYKI